VSDIVSKLRRTTHREYRADGEGSASCLFQEAADEISRLRKIEQAAIEYCAAEDKGLRGLSSGVLALDRMRKALNPGEKG